MGDEFVWWVGGVDVVVKMRKLVRGGVMGGGGGGWKCGEWVRKWVMKD